MKIISHNRQYACEMRAPKINCWKTHKPSMFCPLYSSISKEQHEKHLCNPSNHYGEYENSLVKCVPHILIPESHNASISAMLNLFITWNSMRSTSVIFIPIRSYEERMKAQRGTKVCSARMQALKLLQLVKDTSRDEVMLVSEEIKSVALAVLDLCLCSK